MFLTPRIVHNTEDARKLRDDSVKGLSPENQKSIKETIPPVIGTKPPTEPGKGEVKKGDVKKSGGN